MRLQAQPNFYVFQKGNETYMPLTGDVKVSPAFFGNDTFFAFPVTGETFSLYGRSFTIDSKDSISFSNSGYLRVDIDTTIIIVDGLFTQLDSIDNNSKLSYKVEGTSGNKILKMQLQNLHIAAGSAGNYMNVQIWLYQKTGVVEVRYGSCSANNLTGYSTSNGPYIGMFSSDIDFTKCNEKIWIYGQTATYGIDSARNYVFKPILGVPTENSVYKFVPKTIAASVHGIHASDIECNVYPNPAANVLNVSLVKPLYISASLRLYAMNGQLIKEAVIKPYNTSASIQIHDVAAGNYILNLEVDGISTQQKVTVQH